MLSACEYYIGMSMEEIKKIKTEHQHKPPKDVFRKQIAYQFQEFMEHKDFIILLLSEKVIPENQKVKQYFHEIFNLTCCTGMLCSPFTEMPSYRL